MAYIQELSSVDFNGLTGDEGETTAYRGPAVGVASTGGASAVTRNGSRGPGGLTAAAPTSSALPTPLGGFPTVLPPAVGGNAAPPGLAAGATSYLPYARAVSWEAALELYLQDLAQPPQWNAWQVAAHALSRFFEEEISGLSRSAVSSLISTHYQRLMPRVFGTFAPKKCFGD